MALTVDQNQRFFNNALTDKNVQVEDITVDDINNVAPPVTNPYQQQIYDTIDRYSRALPALPNSTYFPGAGNNIAKGSYSGPTTGTSTAYVESGLIPLGIYGARNERIEAAARAKAKSQSDFYKLMTAPQTTRFSVQADLDEKYYSGLNQWIPVLQQRYGSNWADAAATDTQFQQWNENMGTVAKYNTGMMENAARIEALANDPLFVVHPATLKANREMVAGAGGLFEPTPFGQASNTNVAQKLLEAKAETDLDVAINTATKEFADKEYTSNQGSYPNGIYDVWTTWSTTGMTDDQLDSLADSIWLNAYGGHSDIFSKEIIKERLKDIYPLRAKKELQFQNNQFSNAGGADTVYDESSVNPEEDVVVFGPEGEGDKTDEVSTYDGQTFAKPIKLNVPTSAGAVDPSTGQFTNIPGDVQVEVGKTFNVLVDGQGHPVSKNKAATALITGTSYKTYASGTYTTSEPEMEKKNVYKKDAKGNETNEVDHVENVPTGKTIKVTHTTWIPVESIKSGIATTDENGNVIKGARIDIQAQRAEARNKEKAQQQQNKTIPEAKPRPGEQPTPQQNQSGNGDYLINGKNYTLQQLQAMGYTEEQVAPYLRK